MTAKIKLNAASGGGSVSLKAPSTTTSNAAVELQLPVADGSANQLLKTDGSGNLGWATIQGSTILQVVTTKTTTEVTTSGQTYIDTGLSRTIQPTAANSSILIMLSQFFRITGSNANVGSRVQVLEGSNVAVASTTNDMYYFPGSGQSTSRNYHHRFNIISLHSPSYSLGDTLTYKSQMKSLLDGGATSTHAQEASGDSFLTLMEVAA